LMQHRLTIDEDLINRDYESAADPRFSLFYQMTRITRNRGALQHDDRLDALAIAVAYWTEQMGQDNDKMSEKRKEKLLQNDLKDFMKNVFGKPKARRRLFN
jgi:hypothetical protein